MSLRVGKAQNVFRSKDNNAHPAVDEDTTTTPPSSSGGRCIHGGNHLAKTLEPLISIKKRVMKKTASDLEEQQQDNHDDYYYYEVAEIADPPHHDDDPTTPEEASPQVIWARIQSQALLVGLIAGFVMNGLMLIGGPVMLFYLENQVLFIAATKGHQHYYDSIPSSSSSSSPPQKRMDETLPLACMAATTLVLVFMCRRLVNLFNNVVLPNCSVIAEAIVDKADKDDAVVLAKATAKMQAICYKRVILGMIVGGVGGTCFTMFVLGNNATMTSCMFMCFLMVMLIAAICNASNILYMITGVDVTGMVVVDDKADMDNNDDDDAFPLREIVVVA